MSTTWILIANASRALLYQINKARFFQANGHDNSCLRLVQTFDHAESRMSRSDLTSDREGSYRNYRSSGSYSERTDPKEHEALNFAKELVQKLELGREEGKYQDIIIVATPHFQGLIQRCLSNDLTRLISNTIEKDYTLLKGRELITTLRNQL